MTALNIKTPKQANKELQNKNHQNFLLNHAIFGLCCHFSKETTGRSFGLLFSGDFIIIYIFKWTKWIQTLQLCLCLNENYFFFLAILWLFTIMTRSKNKTVFSYLMAQTFSSYFNLSPEPKLHSQLYVQFSRGLNHLPFFVFNNCY